MSDQNAIYNSLKNEVIHLFAKREIYKSLYESNENRLELLEDVAPILSVYFQKMLLDDIAVTICRILDPKQTGRYENNTLFQIIDECDSCFEDLQDLSGRVDPIRQNRNKLFAHRDLQTTLEHFANNTKNGKTFLELNFPISTQELDVILSKIQALLNYVGNVNMQYGHINTSLGPDLGVKRLVGTLKVGVFYNKLHSDGDINFLELIDEWEKFEFKDA